MLALGCRVASKLSLAMLTHPMALAPTEIRAAIIRNPLVISPSSTVLEAITQMGCITTSCALPPTAADYVASLHDRAQSSCVAVDEAGQVVGILTEWDVVRLGAQKQSLGNLTVGQVMAQPVMTLRESELTDLFTVITLLQQRHIRHLPIVDDQNSLVGLLSYDSLRQITRPIDLLRLRSVGEVMTRQVVCADPHDSLLTIAQLMAHRRVSSVMITTPGIGAMAGLTIPVGIVTERDVVQFQALGLTLAAHRADSLMSTPVFTVKPEDSLWSVQQMMGEHWIRRVAVTGEQGDLVGIITQSSLLQALNPLEMYNLASVLEAKVARLEQEKEQLAAIVASSQDAIISVDLAGIITSWNQAAEQLYGYCAQQMLGQSLHRLIPPDLQIQAEQMFQRLQGGEVIAPYETQRFHKNGQRLEVSLTLSALYDAQGQIVGASKIVRDITERRRNETQRYQTELALQAKTEELDKFFSAAIDLLCIADTDGYFRRLNQQWEKTLGYPLIELEGAKFLDFVHPEDLPSTLEQITHLTHQQEVSSFTNRYRCRDGAYRWLEWRSIPIGTIIYAAARDITERKVTEQALLESEARYRNIIETTLEGVWILAADGQTTFVNQRMADMLGYTTTEMIGQSLTDFMAPADHPQAQTYFQRRQQGIEEQHTFRFQRRDGQALWAIVSASLLRDGEGHFSGCIGLLTDITELVTTQEALQTSKMQLSGVLNSSLDGVMAFRSIRDPQGTIVDFEYLLANPTACTMMERPSPEIMGQRLLDLMPGHLESGLFATYVQVVESGDPNHQEFYYNHDGLESWFEHVAVKLGDGFAVTFRDVTNRKRSEQTLHLINQQLQERIADLNQRHTEQRLLSEMNGFLQACLTVEEACAAFRSLVSPLFPHCAGGLFLTAATQITLTPVATWGEAFDQCHDFPKQDCWALRWGHRHVWESSQSGMGCPHLPAPTNPVPEPTAPAQPSATSLCIPMVAQGEPIGLFSLYATTATALPEVKQQLAHTVAEQMALAIANLNLRATLQRQSIRDALTGLFNRRYLEEFLAQEIVRAQRYQRPISLIMIDIDHFKQVNDTYGHETGDDVLRGVSAVITESVRGSDMACRYGGEELVIVLPEVALEQAMVKAEMLRQAIAALSLSVGSQPLGPITVSLGVAEFPRHGGAGAMLLQTADAALYRAKAAGRNQVCAAPDLSSPSFSPSLS